MPVRLRVSAYPLQHALPEMGLWVALAAGLIFASLLAAFAFFVLFLLVGTLWRRDETPSVAFTFGYQWLFAVAGYLHYQIVGRYPGMAVGELDLAVAVSLLAFLSMAAGFRGALRISGRSFESRLRCAAPTQPYAVHRLFWTVILLYAVDWFLVISPMTLWFEAAQPIYRILELRTVLLLLLLLEVFRQRRGFGYAATAIAYVMVPSFASPQSAFGGVLTAAFVAVLHHWQPWAGSPKIRRRAVHITWAGAAAAASLLVSAMVWNSEIKAPWREIVRTGLAGRSPLEKVTSFAHVAATGVDRFEWHEGLESLATRVSSGAGFFSLVLARVPEASPHENGALTLRAIYHVSHPRILFPEKPNLGSDSWLVRKYAGTYVAGEETATSIGLGYMAQFYIDFGLPWMFVPLVAYGFLFGTTYVVLLRCSPSLPFFNAAAGSFFLVYFTTYDAEIAKQLGAVLQGLMGHAAALYFLGPWMHRQLLVSPRTRTVAAGTAVRSSCSP